MFDAMERGELKALYVIGENPIQSEADQQRTRAAARRPRLLVVQDIFLTATARDRRRRAAGGRRLVRVRGHGHLQRAPRAARAPARPPPAGEARDDLEILFELARPLGHDWGAPDAETVWNELRSLSPVHAGMSYARLEASGGLQWPCYDEHASRRALPARPALGAAGASGRARRSTSSCTTLPVDGSTPSSRCA